MNDPRTSGAPPSGPLSARPNAATEKRTLVEEGTSFKGSLSSTCPILLKGVVSGDLEAPSLTVASTGSVSGKVKVGQLKSEGELSGEFDVDSIVLSGTVKDDTVLRAKTLEVKLAAGDAKMQVVFGTAQLEIGEAPSRDEGEAKAGGADGASTPPPSAKG